MNLTLGPQLFIVKVSTFSADDVEEEDNWKKKGKKIDDDRDINEEEGPESNSDQVLCDLYGLLYERRIWRNWKKESDNWRLRGARAHPHHLKAGSI
ncbi:hypothetical protein SUNI508_06630 [Seiridium unicorne]|uniref:Uncharacterized protein n=1 Tax=Seiridium unicorne TaxID=138068 RepID=A0ABR2V0K2_9PEZI